MKKLHYISQFKIDFKIEPEKILKGAKGKYLKHCLSMQQPTMADFLQKQWNIFKNLSQKSASSENNPKSESKESDFYVSNH